MIKKDYILTIILIGLFSYSSFGQGSSQATMRVSVKVVSGNSVEAVQPSFVSLNKDIKSSLGMLTMKGMENVLVQRASTLTLTSERGKKIKMNILSQRGKNKSGSDSIRYEGISKSELVDRVYQGELTTNIQYL